MKIKAKFKCISSTEFEGGNKEVKFQPVIGKGNEDFSKYTPSGDLRMFITPETAAVNFFEPGKSYNLIFEVSES